ncbi:hypothetical protein A3D80_01615 [Candidatus Roizmanbacteria bacterium RIFCSPHIGHO2_02_FULL_40_13b]|uniref:Transposase IS200-like domain-containing protein n=1 Tax=Candidatus Roizmanbacteria bacterium RIFCSPHIGHO2_01_FULL_39_24 TaxID=1802032 RepID=A0A1F7GFC2_9BACT|nr:MAG: hypothetical protein A2799_00930 [Candidatus Roizmanbacteria bacterium RIFCSPHIGHO2_01_FULL_39_24]OGK26821.1 MAG: hypothetical protein A3D80_01615 [Candidatus Roizmanbacteria bacterium RIFCSPHIGHO2_02_FULL_40_13b]OGK48744.1 MAG: hypothetical protein A3A56_03150 [Candidatus Roizmanbacteria bacterium RIFCSPLOWO2_01_FULL_40_32]
MPGRKTPLVTGSTYHIFNRGVAKMPTFTDGSEYERAIELVKYYRFENPPLKYSILVSLPRFDQNSIISSMKKNNQPLVRIISFVLMPNHFHFTLTQLVEGGISKFMSNFTNSFTRYVNTKKKRPGPLFQGTFKSVLIDTEEQLLHLSRYQHLNPFTNGVVDSFDDLINYPYSSLPHYLGIEYDDFVDTSSVLSSFKKSNGYRKFIENQKNYQRKLARIKKIFLD